MDNTRSPRVLAISWDRMEVDGLRERGVPAHIAETKEAVRIHNDLAETQPVGALFHSTC